MTKTDVDEVSPILWQPIETAPRDGSTVLVLIDGDVFQSSWDKTNWSFPVANYHGCGCCSDWNDSPTHWQPLPSEPDGV